MCVCVCVEGKGECTDTKNAKMQVSTLCRACGKTNNSKSKNSNFELSSK